MSTYRSKTITRNGLTTRNLSPKELEEVIAATKAMPNGAAAMRVAADKALHVHSSKIADALAKSAEAGHMMAARLLYLIANDQVTLTAEEIRKTRSLAALWEAELQYEAERKQMSAETAGQQSQPVTVCPPQLCLPQPAGTAHDAPHAAIDANIAR